MTRPVALVLFALAIPCSAHAQEKVKFDDLVKLADKLQTNGQIKVSSARLEVQSPSETEKETLRFSPSEVGVKVVKKEPSVIEAAYQDCVLGIIEDNDLKLYFKSSPILTKSIEKREAINKSIFDLANSDLSDEDKNEKIGKLALERNKELQNGLDAYAKAKNLTVKRWAEYGDIEATLVTEPKGGKIYMLSIFEYELCNLRGQDADQELAKNLITTNPARMSGWYYFLVEWGNGTKSKVTKILINATRTYTLK